MKARNGLVIDVVAHHKIVHIETISDIKIFFIDDFKTISFVKIDSFVVAINLQS